MFDYRRVMGISVVSFSMGCWDWKECYVEYCQWDHFFCWQIPGTLGMIPLTTKARLEFLHSEQWPAHYGWRWFGADLLGCEDAGLQTWMPKYGWCSPIDFSRENASNHAKIIQSWHWYAAGILIFLGCWFIVYLPTKHCAWYYKPCSCHLAIILFFSPRSL